MAQTVSAFERVVPPAVFEFCAEHDLLPHLETAIRLAGLHFAPCQDLQLSVESDPETNDMTVVIDVALEMDVAEVLRRKQSYTRDLVASTPAIAREKFRLLYDIVSL